MTTLSQMHIYQAWPKKGPVTCLQLLSVSSGQNYRKLLHTPVGVYERRSLFRPDPHCRGAAKKGSGMMAHQTENRALAVFADGEPLSVAAPDSGTLCHQQLLGSYEAALDAGARRILVDKRQMVTSWDSSVCKETVKAVGRIFGHHQAKLAVVIDQRDHIEKATCLGIMQHGAKVLSTYDIEEAKSWLAGEIF